MITQCFSHFSIATPGTMAALIKEVLHLGFTYSFVTVESVAACRQALEQ